MRKPSFQGLIRYDRSVSEEFLANFLDGGFAASLREYAGKARFPVDLQLRHNPKTGDEHAALYAGLTSVLNVVSERGPGLALTAHKTWSDGPYGFDPSWRVAAPVADWSDRWSAVEDYLEKVIPKASFDHGRTEGAVQAAASAFFDGTRVMLDREVLPHFLDTPTRTSVLTPLSAALADALVLAQPVPGKVPTSFGSECDLLALDDKGRLMAIEVKPSVSSLVWTPAQATMYSQVLQAWIADDPGWKTVVTTMLDQRQRLGLAPPFVPNLPDVAQVVPVIAVQRGASATYLYRLWTVQQALLDAGVGDPALEVYEVSLSGRLTSVERPQGLSQSTT